MLRLVKGLKALELFLMRVLQMMIWLNHILLVCQKFTDGVIDENND